MALYGPSKGHLGPPPKRKAHRRGAPRKHGRNGPAAGHLFKLKSAHLRKQADQDETVSGPLRGQRILGQAVRLRAWHACWRLHFVWLAELVGTAICVEFLKADGMPRYKRPL